MNRRHPGPIAAIAWLFCLLLGWSAVAMAAAGEVENRPLAVEFTDPAQFSQLTGLELRDGAIQIGSGSQQGLAIARPVATSLACPSDDTSTN